MKISFRLATAVATISILLTGAVVWSQQPGAPASPAANVKHYKLAVVDLSAVFKNHKRFKASADSLREEAKKFETGMRQEQEAIKAEQEGLKQFQSGSPEYKAKDEALSRRKASFALSMDKARKDFLERETNLHETAYAEVSQAVAAYARFNDIGLVLQFRSVDDDSSGGMNPQKTINKINNPIVYQNGIDITSEIILMMNRSQTAQRPGGSPPPPGVH